MKFVLDRYLRFPIVLDSVITLAIISICRVVVRRVGIVLQFDHAHILDVISSLIGTCVSLAGFILAALTIIITFKSNLHAKGLEEANNALELILSSKHYDDIVKVYKDAILEFVLAVVIMYSAWLLSENLSNAALVYIATSGVCITSLCILRSLMILFRILNMSKHSKGQDVQLKNVK